MEEKTNKWKYRDKFPKNKTAEIIFKFNKLFPGIFDRPFETRISPNTPPTKQTEI